MSTEELCTPQTLYHNIWSLLFRSFWFKERLVDWQKWEHCFDDQLVTDADAVRFANEMIATLQEEYTELLAPKPKPAGDTDDDETPCCIAKMLPGNIGYIKISTFNGNLVAVQIHNAMNSIADAVAFVVDLRGNGGGNIGQANKALSLLIEQGDTYIFKKRHPDDDYFEAFCRIEKTQFAERTDYLRPGHESDAYDTWSRYRNITGNKPMVALVNGRTGSAAELFAGVLRDNDRAVLIGTKTIGKGIGQHTLPVGNGYQLQITDSVFLPPSGQWFGDVGQTVRNGIVPHVEVPMEDDGDSQLDAALKRLSHTLNGAHQMQYQRRARASHDTAVSAAA